MLLIYITIKCEYINLKIRINIKDEDNKFRKNNQMNLNTLVNPIRVP